MREAYWQEKELEIGDADKYGEVTQRSILPLCLMYTNHKLIVLAWCNPRHDYRMFDIRRVAMLRDYLAH